MQRKTGLALVTATALAVPVHAAQPALRNPPGAEASAGAVWAQFRGPHRDGECAETGLLQAWPEAGPPKLWEIAGIGRGYSSPVFGRDTLFITGDIGDDLVIAAFGLDGRPKWRSVNGRSWTRAVPGARATCTLAGGRLYHMNGHGRIVCLDPADGREIWAVDLLARFHSENIQWGISECVLVDGDRVIVTPGGPETLMVALDGNTGVTLWKTEPLRFVRTQLPGGRALDAPRPDCDRAGYAPPVLFERGGRRLIAGCSARHAFVVDAERGRLLAHVPIDPARWEVIGAGPVPWRDSLIISAPDFGTRRYRIALGSDGAVSLDPVWEAATDNCHGGFVVIEGRLYGAGYRRAPSWSCIDLETGRVLYTHPELIKGAPLLADNRIYALAENGSIALLEPAPTGFVTRGRFDVPRDPTLGRRTQRDAWAHPVIHQGRLYLRNHDVLACYDVARGPAPAGDRR